MAIPPKKTNPQLVIYGQPEQITRIFNWFIVFIFTGLGMGIVILLTAKNTLPAILIGISLLPILASLYFVRYKKFELAAVFLAVILISLITLTATVGLGIHHISILGYPAILIVASLVVRKRTMVFLTLFNILCLAWLVFGELSGKYKPGVLVHSVPGDFLSASIILILTAIMVRLISEAMFQNNQELQKELGERKLAEEKYRNIFENAVDGIFQSTPDGRFISVNPAMARIYGYDSPEEMIESITDISSQLYVESELRNLLRNRMENGEKVTGFESHEYRKDGTTHWTSMNAQSIRDSNGNILYYEGTVEDITERKLAQDSLRKRESILEAITFSAEQFLKTPNWREKIETVLERLGREFNASHAYLFEKYMDISGGELVSLRYEWTAPGQKPDIDNPKYKNVTAYDPDFERYYRILDTGEPFIGSASFYTEAEKNKLFPSGIKALLEMRIVANGKQWGTIGFDDKVNDREWTSMEVDVIKVAANILGAAIKRQLDDEALKQELIERMRAEQALMFSEEKFSKAFHTTPVMMSIDDASGFFIDVNKAFIDKTGFDRKDILGHRASDLNMWTALEDRQKIQKLIQDQGSFKDIELGFQNKAGKTFIVLMSSEKFHVNDEAYTLTSALDITERKQAEAEREKLIGELEAKNEELERFTYTVSHDLKSPLVTINGFLGYLEQDASSGNTERLRKDTHRIQDAVNKMQRLLNELLELSRIGRMMNPPETLSFEELVSEALDIVHGQFEQLKVTVQMQPNLPSVYADKPRLIEVLQNILDNAAKYMGDQSSPHIEIGYKGDENGKSIFYIKDNGIGIAPEYHERVFGLFNKLDAKTEGTGVGLALVKRIIEVHGGRIWVESQPGQGSTFHFTLPKSPN